MDVIDVMDVMDELWAILEPLIGEMPRRADGRGRPWRSSREVLNEILWILRTGGQWADLPDRYPLYQTCHRRYQRWVREGLFERILEALALELKERGKLDLSEWFVDGTFIVAKKAIVHNGPLRPGLSADEATDTIWTLTSAEVHHLLTVDRRWSREQYVRWLGDTLVLVLLP